MVVIVNIKTLNLLNLLNGFAQFPFWKSPLSILREFEVDKLANSIEPCQTPHRLTK